MSNSGFNNGFNMELFGPGLFMVLTPSVALSVKWPLVYRFGGSWLTSKWRTESEEGCSKWLPSCPQSTWNR
jgi:hypothetical protein